MTSLHHAYNQGRGTLTPGQSISVNKFTVQVERYLAQGGFAHVYLVRTATSVYNTTHHVLKRIAVPSESMLAEVKKEVDVMRLLKGHPNIVHLIDASWQQMPNGSYEVFILMEFCPGGGIIDMMNRRLRERLTQAEILQIFVDVCEGVAFMHSLQPALLHRDLKVENILQSSATSYKLCDFGSAAPVSRPPASIQELRVLEADLNRHTTLQYRAPEMVDVYSRRPVDEKSDVWALGVLLYKLCYYTTPFEEHGQLAILNVQYRIPPYPVYSPQINQLIASMLQEHGVRRPTIFELLESVHHLRGTKSRFKYTVPTPTPLSPRNVTQFRPSPPTNRPSPTNTTSTFNKTSLPMSPSRSQGIQAREKVMEAIAPLIQREQTSPHRSGVSSIAEGSKLISDSQIVTPMRRGRPAAKEVGVSSSIHGPSIEAITDRERESSLLEAKIPNSTTPKTKTDSHGSAFSNIWGISDARVKSNDKNGDLEFDDNFAQKARGAVETTKPPTSNRENSPLSSVLSAKSHPPDIISSRTPPTKDAFDGLGLSLPPRRPEPTLAEARKLRTGLAIVNNNGYRTNPEKSSPAFSRFSPSQQPIMTSLQLYPASVSSTTLFTPFNSQATVSAESRFPSLEELDVGFSFNQSSSITPDPTSLNVQKSTVTPSRHNGTSPRPSARDDLLKPDSEHRNRQLQEAKAEHFTGLPVSEYQEPRVLSGDRRTPDAPVQDSWEKQTSREAASRDVHLRPGLTKKHRSSVIMKHAQLRSKEEPLDSLPIPSPLPLTAEPKPQTPSKSKDWLTGDGSVGPSTTAVSSYLMSTKPVSSATTDISPTLSKFTRSFPSIDAFELLDGNVYHEKGTAKLSQLLSPSKNHESESSNDEGPEDVNSVGPFEKPQKRTHKGRQSSVHDLVDLYGGGIATKEKSRTAQTPRPLQVDPEPLLRDSKGRSLNVPINSAKSQTSSPSATLQLPPTSGESRTLGDVSPSISIPSPSPSRSRPHSMIIFPSKSIDSLSPPSKQPTTSLVHPEDAKTRTSIRRTSISDMVQKFEGMAPQATLLSSPRSHQAGNASNTPNDYRISRGWAPASEEPTSISSTQNELESRSLPKSPGDSSRMSSFPKPIHNPQTMATGSPSSGFPARKIPDDLLSRTDDRSPSPERPYQGVGKLIDQWQRKTAEADAQSSTPKGRGTNVIKRGGTIHISSK